MSTMVMRTLPATMTLSPGLRVRTSTEGPSWMSATALNGTLRGPWATESRHREAEQVYRTAGGAIRGCGVGGRITDQVREAIAIRGGNPRGSVPAKRHPTV